MKKSLISRFFSPGMVDSPPDPPLRRQFALLFVIFLVALTLRILNVFEFRANDPMFNRSLPMLDMHQFQQWIQNIVDTHWLDRENTPFWQAPLYAYTMAIIAQIFGRDLLWIKLFQAALGSVTCALIYFVGRKSFNARVGLIASLLACFYGMFFLYEAVLLRESFLTLVFLLSIASLLIARERGGYRWYFLSGICLGMNVLGRENLLLFVPLAIIWTWIYCREPFPKARAARVAVVLAGFVLTIAPVTAKNYLVGDEFVLISKGGGFNFYLANCREGNGTVSTPPSMLKIAPNLYRMTSQELASIDWMGLAMQEIAEDPGHFIGLLPRKLYMYWGSYEMPNNVNYYLAKRFSWVLRLPLISYWLILPFTVTGIILSLKKRPQPAPLLLLALLLGYTVSILLVCIVARYRVPIIPYYLIFAGFALEWWHQRARAGDFRKIALSLIPFLLVSIFSLATRADYVRPNDYYNIALVNQIGGNYSAAIVDYENALRVDPGFSPARSNLIVCYLSLNRLQEAEQVALEGTRREPENSTFFSDLAIVLQEMGRIDEAAEVLEHALVLDPDHAAGRRKLADLYQLQGRLTAAEAEREKASRLIASGGQAVE